MRYWDGAQWTGHVATPQVQPQPVMVQQAGAYYPHRVVTKQHKRTSHGLHLFLTIITFGMWGIFVWLPITIWHRSHKGERIVTHYR